MPSPWWIAICAGLLSGSFSALATYTLNYNRDSNEYRRNKAEDFYVSVDQYVFLFKITVLHDLAVEDKSVSPLTDEQSLEMSKSYKNVKMSCAIHFTQLSNKVDAMMSIRDSISARFEASNRHTSDDRKAIRKLVVDLERCATDLKMYIARAARHGAPLSLMEAAGQLLGLKK